MLALTLWLGTSGGRNRQRAFFDARVFNPFARSYSRLPLSRCYRTHEQEKRRACDEQIWEVERACFSPLVFAASGGMGPIATTVYRRLASLLANKWGISYIRCLYWIRCRLCFSLLKSSVMCLRGNQSSNSHSVPANVDLGYSEGQPRCWGPVSDAGVVRLSST